jgi:hypothetical protein
VVRCCRVSGLMMRLTRSTTSAGTGTDAASGDRDGEMSLSGTGPADQHDVALLGEEGAAGEVIDERLVDWRPAEPEVDEVLPLSLMVKAASKPSSIGRVT